MQAGKLRTRLLIQTPTGAVDTVGEQTGAYTTVTTVWAEFITSRGSESGQNNRMEGEVSHQVRIRYQSGLALKSKMRLSTLDDSRHFDILGIVNVDERNEEWLLDVKENV